MTSATPQMRCRLFALVEICWRSQAHPPALDLDGAFFLRVWSVKVGSTISSTIKSSAIVAALLATTAIGSSTATWSAKITPGYAPSCDGLHGTKLNACQKQRALAEAQAQCKGTGGRQKGCGPKAKDCYERANGFGVDSATPTSWAKDC